MNSTASIVIRLGAMLRVAQDTAEELAKALSQSHPSGFDFGPIKQRLLARCGGEGNISDAEAAMLIEAQEQVITALFATFRKQNEDSATRIN